ncbi:MULTISPECIES: electron transporter [Cyanophyceae]|uniref:cyclic electron transport protein PGR5 n=1 Tax=Cyanophyceae TaxID=3028117 RepID=UPI0016880519|nr:MULTISPECIES: electron transporter [unclassified Phormidium]MBD1918728.1 electron transporter [Phormidium sp. FACHB-77]MBD2029065.1 electron transporter [Phormidium sp. FACHB-322]MBD2051347.1 electron transporter [Leptolyngbya sp. FACHB-60]
MVLLVRNIMGTPKFNKLRGQAIALHSKTITNFCNCFSIDSKEHQALIRKVKANGQRLGFLA